MNHYATDPESWLGQVQNHFDRMIPESGDDWGCLVQTAFLILPIDPLDLARDFHVSLADVQRWRDGYYCFFERRVQILLWFRQRMEVVVQERMKRRYGKRLWGAHKGCDHEIEYRMAGGVGCTRCPGWYCV